jgi:hypothetical protein
MNVEYTQVDDSEAQIPSEGTGVGDPLPCFLAGGEAFSGEESPFGVGDGFNRLNHVKFHFCLSFLLVGEALYLNNDIRILAAGEGECCGLCWFRGNSEITDY